MARAAIDHVVRECLAKDPESRWQNAADVARELRWIASSASGTSPATPVNLRRRWRARLLWSVVAAALLGALAWANLGAPAPARTRRSYVPPPAEAGSDFPGDFLRPPTFETGGAAPTVRA